MYIKQNCTYNRNILRIYTAKKKIFTIIIKYKLPKGKYAK